FVQKAVERIPDKKFIYDREDLKRLPKRTADSNKGTYGNVLVFAGSDNMSGAAYFSAKAAYRMGAGLVRVMTVKSNKEAIQTLLPEAVLSFYDEVSKEELSEYVGRAAVIVMAPGLSMGKAAGKILYEIFDLLSGSGKKVVLDADALNIIARDKRHELLKGCIITPHLGEMARLTGNTVSKIKERLIAAAKEFSGTYQCVCVLKDARSIVSDGKNVYLNVSGNSGMSTAGSGDVLTGIIGGLLAGGMDPYSGAVLGTYIHGLAGDCAKESLGEYFMKADDIIDFIKNVIYG
ncbi:MAG: NAD(P)H-hydrate dehydratase, partial [Alistipes sp.]|nr:NAD(P)H-hydrate dehydratase [Alistipes sp.]